MLPTFYRQEVTIVRPGTKLSRGSEVFDWDNVSTKKVTKCHVQPAGTSITLDGRVEGITDGLTAYLPMVDVRAGDRIIFEEGTYLIKGEPRRWTSASGRMDHIILNLERYYG